MNDSGRSLERRGALLQGAGGVDRRRARRRRPRARPPAGRLGGGLAGHNGLRSIAAALGSQDFLRLRMGVGRPERGDRRPSPTTCSRRSTPQDDVDALVARSADGGVARPRGSRGDAGATERPERVARDRARAPTQVARTPARRSAAALGRTTAVRGRSRSGSSSGCVDFAGADAVRARPCDRRRDRGRRLLGARTLDGAARPRRRAGRGRGHAPPLRGRELAAGVVPAHAGRRAPHGASGPRCGRSTRPARSWRRSRTTRCARAARSTSPARLRAPSSPTSSWR